MKFLSRILLFLALAFSVNTQFLQVTEKNGQHLKDLIEDIDIIDILGLNNCTADINQIYDQGNTLLKYLNNDQSVQAFYELCLVFSSVSKLSHSCPEINTRFSYLEVLLKKLYSSPGKIIEEGFDNLRGLSTIKSVWGLLGELNKDDLAEAGNTLKALLKKFLQPEIKETQSIVLLEEMSDDRCLEVLKNIKNDMRIILLNIFRDVKKVKEALDDFVFQLKSIPNACFKN